MNRNHIKKSSARNGYTLLFAVITASLVLSVGVFILGVSKKQFALSVAARESMYALYAADSGIECAAREYNYNTDPEGGLATSTGGILRQPTMECNGELHTADSAFEKVTNPDETIWDTDEPVYQAGDIKVFFSDNGSSIDSCAMIMVAYGTNTNGNDVVRMTSRGYNQCDANGPLPSSRTVERALRLTTSN